MLDLPSRGFFKVYHIDAFDRLCPVEDGLRPLRLLTGKASARSDCYSAANLLWLLCCYL